MKKSLSKRKSQEIGKRVWAVRKALDLDQKVLGKRMGLSQAIISQYESGITEISLSFLEYLNKKNGISSDWMLFGTGEMNIKNVKRKKGTKSP